MQSEVGRMFRRLMTRAKINNELNSYPCSDYLHNALRFIAQGEANVAYDEICHAIIRSGGRLTESEEEYRKKVQE